MRILNEDDEVKYEISMTPLIDIFCLLIIFFLLTTSFMQLEQDLDIDLPKQGKLKVKAPPSKPVVVNVRHLPGGKAYYHVQNEPMTLATLTSHLSRAKVRNKDQAVVIRGDRRVKWEHVAAVMGRCGQVGITKVSATVEVDQSQ